MLSDEVSRVERAKKTALLCETMASAIRRDVYAMARCNKIGTAIGEGDKFVSLAEVCNKVREKEIVDELKKKVLELRYMIDKQNDYIKKYQIALEIASVDIVKCIEEGLEGCSVCPERIYCEAHRHDTIRLGCDEILLESWKKKAGIE